MSNKLAEQLKKIQVGKGVKFLEVLGYTNKKGEVSDYVINADMSYSEAVKRDISFLEKWNPTSKDVKKFQEILEGCDKMPKDKGVKEVLLDAKDALLKSLKKETVDSQIRSDGQISAYEDVGPVTKRHIETGVVHLKGLLVEKRVIHKPENGKKSPNSGAPVRAKNFIKSKFLKTGKIAQFKLDQFENAQIDLEKETIVIK